MPCSWRAEPVHIVAGSVTGTDRTAVIQNPHPIIGGANATSTN
jgi:hypothetical protein